MTQENKEKIIVIIVGTSAVITAVLIFGLVGSFFASTPQIPQSNIVVNFSKNLGQDKLPLNDFCELKEMRSQRADIWTTFYMMTYKCSNHND